MPTDKWNQLIIGYREVYLHSRYAENAEGLLDLIPLIQDDPVFFDVIPTTSLTALCLRIPDKEAQIVIWFENKQFSVSIKKSPREDLAEWTEVSSEQIVSVLREHIQTIRELS